MKAFLSILALFVIITFAFAAGAFWKAHNPIWMLTLSASVASAAAIVVRAMKT
ncbi:hypothetical protein HYS28_03790 [Candidatus Uhrbacteria bacterium]|nr:hypothetical protein [Candidatus Uhrbacteria bacterium]